jgi:hypothetical protein
MFGLKIEIRTSLRYIPQLIETKQQGKEAECFLGCVRLAVGQPQVLRAYTYSGGSYSYV